ncbi:hypothetical protein AVEN_113070-1 [Araneus ventricosus]|uniref:Uncharacterized protein n=1 Tax=Araneus ventricosus TaxID=182803 RepID=A0A4Y2VTZ6_ARAVE|nr:hypothetical protein AVEN_113070-1 [Araneus ventricosus]
MKQKRKLRIFISNTFYPGKPEGESGEEPTVPSWELRVEGRLLDDDILSNSLLTVNFLITSGDWTFQQINSSDAYFVLYKILYEVERCKWPSQESLPESNGRPLGLSSSICLQEWATVEKQV